jgi:hypothetical protein
MGTRPSAIAQYHTLDRRRLLAYREIVRSSTGQGAVAIETSTSAMSATHTTPAVANAIR